MESQSLNIQEMEPVLSPMSAGGGRVQRKHVQNSNSNSNNNKKNNSANVREAHKEAAANNNGATGSSRVRSRRRAAENPETGSKGGSGGGSSSIIWTVLVIGLLFSLLDVIYMVSFVERQQENQGLILIEQQSSITREQQLPQPVPALSESEPESDSDSDGNGEIQGEESDLFAGKERIIQLLKAAGVTVDPDEDKDLIEDLPTWSEVVGLYGPEPVIYGLDECDGFQHMSDPADHFVSTAGTFNSGTNLMAELLIANCHMQPRMDKYGAPNRGVRWQVPWGKHTPPGDDTFRHNHKTKHDGSIDANNILPAVTIRDPLVWLGSMCRHEYAAKWDHPDANHCPDFSLPNLETSIHYSDFQRKHESIVHLWNDYYQEYLQVSFARLIVRFEDLVFHPEEVTKSVCECAGGSMRPDGKFKYVVDSAKKGENAHGKTRTGYVDAIVKYGSAKRRYSNYHFSSDLEYIRDNVDDTLMSVMAYPPVDPTKLQSPD